MTAPVTGAAQSQPVEPATSPAAQKPPQTKPQPTPTPTDTVSISNAAKAALKEAMETPTQTAQEARGGDHQAQRLLAKEEAAAAESGGR
jgi:hypothetical protein